MLILMRPYMEPVTDGRGFMRKWIAIPIDAYDRFLEDDGWAIASHIALSTLTSLFPFLIFATALGGFFGSQELADQAAEALLESWPQAVAKPIASEIHNVLTQSRGGLLTIGVVLALYFSSSGVEALRVGLNRAYGERERRSWYLLRLESVGYVLVGAFALLALAVLVDADEPELTAPALDALHRDGAVVAVVRHHRAGRHAQQIGAPAVVAVGAHR